jgi:CheY-like chemotaxis protein
MARSGYFSVDSLKGVHILVADDEALARDVLRDILEYCGALVLTVNSARDALESMRLIKPDVLVTKLQMPGEDAFWLLRQVRALKPEAGGEIPVIAIGGTAGDRERCLAAGMDAYVSKPLRAEELFAAIDRVCGLSPSPVAMAAPISVAARSVGDGEGVDRESLVASFGRNEKVLREVIGVFLDDAQHLVSAVEGAAARRDAESLASAAHALKGSVGLFTKGAAFEQARRIEQRAKAGDLVDIDRDCAVLKEDVTRLTRELNELREGGQG